MKSLDALIHSGGIVHNGEPVLEWMIDKIYARRDTKDNVYPRNARNENKIDGTVAFSAERW